LRSARADGGDAGAPGKRNQPYTAPAPALESTQASLF
jgi:hypothetical protein